MCRCQPLVAMQRNCTNGRIAHSSGVLTLLGEMMISRMAAGSCGEGKTHHFTALKLGSTKVICKFAGTPLRDVAPNSECVCTWIIIAYTCLIQFWNCRTLSLLIFSRGRTQIGTDPFHPSVYVASAAASSGDGLRCCKRRTLNTCNSSSSTSSTVSVSLL